MGDAWPVAPSELCGVWRRNWIKKPAEGEADSSIEVRYVQTPGAFVDVRVAKERPKWPSQPYKVGEIQEVVEKRKAEAFAGVTTVEGDVVRWHACINLEPRAEKGGWAKARTGSPRETDDAGTCRRVQGRDQDGGLRLWHEHAWPDSSVYVEEWERVDDDDEPKKWLAALNETNNEILVVCGDYFGHARDHRNDIEHKGATLSACAFTDAAWTSLSVGRVSTGWLVETTAVGFFEGRRLVVQTALDEWEILPGSTLALADLTSDIAPDVLWRPGHDVAFFPRDDNTPSPPTEHLLTPRLFLTQLDPFHLDADFEAVVESVGDINNCFKRNDTWPWPGITRTEDFEDLNRHDSEFNCDLAFAYTVLDPDSKACLGCCYINPPTRRGCDAEVFLWIRSSADRKDLLDADLEAGLRAWIASDVWPYVNPAFPGRDPPPDGTPNTFENRWAHWESLPWLKIAWPRISVDCRTIVTHDPRDSGLLP